MKTRIAVILLVATILMVAFATLEACAPRRDVTVPDLTRTLHLGHPASAGTAFDVLANRIKEYVETRSNGRYTVLVYTDATLGHQDMMVEAMIAGTVDMALVNSAVISNYAGDLAVLDLPFLFSDWDEVEKFLHSDIMGEFYAITDAAGVATLALMPRGFRHVINNRGPIYDPSDFEDLSIRVLNTQVFIDTFTALGAKPEGIPWEDTYAAIQDGLVEGKENTIVTINDYGFYRIQKYLSLTGHFFSFAAVMASPITMDSIPADDQTLIRQAAFDAAMSVGAEQLADEIDALENLRRNGMLINEITDKQPFIDMMEPVYESFFRTHDSRYYELIISAIR